jgi:hypothetical protein
MPFEKLSSIAAGAIVAFSITNVSNSIIICPYQDLPHLKISS